MLGEQDLLDMLGDDIKLDVKPSNESKPDYSGSNKKRNPNSETYWDKTDIKPLAPKTSDFSRSGKSFTVYGIYEGKDVLPDTIIEKFVKISTALSGKGYTFRHYGSKTNNLQTAILNIDGMVSESYLPWPKWNENITKPTCKYPENISYHIAAHYTKKFQELKPTIRAIISSYTNAILGKGCVDPVDLLIMYNPTGVEAITKDMKFAGLGDIPRLLKLCDECSIPFYNIGSDSALTKLIEFIKTLG